MLVLLLLLLLLVMLCDQAQSVEHRFVGVVVDQRFPRRSERRLEAAAAVVAAGRGRLGATESERRRRRLRSECDGRRPEVRKTSLGQEFKFLSF